MSNASDIDIDIDIETDIDIILPRLKCSNGTAASSGSSPECPGSYFDLSTIVKDCGENLTRI